MGEFYQTFQEQLISNVTQTISKPKEEQALPKSSDKADKSWALKPNKDFKRKENEKPVSFTNIAAIVQSKMLKQNLAM